MEKLTGRSKSDSMLMKSSKVKKSTFNNESLKTMGLDVREVSAMSGRTYKTYTETPKFNIFKKKK